MQAQKDHTKAVEEAMNSAKAATASAAQEIVKFANEKVIKDFLDCYEDFTRALETEDNENFIIPTGTVEDIYN